MTNVLTRSSIFDDAISKVFVTVDLEGDLAGVAWSAYKRLISEKNKYPNRQTVHSGIHSSPVP